MATTNDVRRWYAYSTKERSIFNPQFRVKPGIVEVRYPEWAAQYAGRLLVEPHIKGTFSGENKRWPWEHWEELVKRSPLPLAQCAPKGKRVLEGVEGIETPSFHHAVSVLAVAKGLITTEGGLHHAAGALGTPAVIIFGAFNSPEMFGYDFHINLAEPNPEALGWRRTHPACVEAMRKITPQRVLDAMVALWS